MEEWIDWLIWVEVQRDKVLEKSKLMKQKQRLKMSTKAFPTKASETLSIESYQYKSKVWLRVDHAYYLAQWQTFFEKLNSQLTNFQFTMAVKNNNCLPCFWVLGTGLLNDLLGHSVYRTRFVCTSIRNTTHLRNCRWLMILSFERSHKQKSL